VNEVLTIVSVIMVLVIFVGLMLLARRLWPSASLPFYSPPTKKSRLTAFFLGLFFAGLFVYLIFLTRQVYWLLLVASVALVGYSMGFYGFLNFIQGVRADAWSREEGCRFTNNDFDVDMVDDTSTSDDAETLPYRRSQRGSRFQFGIVLRYIGYGMLFVSFVSALICAVYGFMPMLWVALGCLLGFLYLSLFSNILIRRSLND
jgi:hypothetical protein